MTEQFLLTSDFKAGVQVRAGKGFTCLEEGRIYTAENDGNGTPCLRCQFKGQAKPGYHYPLDGRNEGRLKELYEVAPPQTPPQDAREK